MAWLAAASVPMSVPYRWRVQPDPRPPAVPARPDGATYTAAGALMTGVTYDMGNMVADLGYRMIYMPQISNGDSALPAGNPLLHQPEHHPRSAGHPPLPLQLGPDGQSTTKRRLGGRRFFLSVQRLALPYRSKISERGGISITSLPLMTRRTASSGALVSTSAVQLPAIAVGKLEIDRAVMRVEKDQQLPPGPPPCPAGRRATGAGRGWWRRRPPSAPAAARRPPIEPGDAHLVAKTLAMQQRLPAPDGNELTHELGQRLAGVRHAVPVQPADLAVLAIAVVVAHLAAPGPRPRRAASGCRAKTIVSPGNCVSAGRGWR